MQKQLIIEYSKVRVVGCILQKSVENTNKGVDYMLMAAEAGDRSAMLYMAKAYETGVGLGENRYRCKAAFVLIHQLDINLLGCWWLL